MKAEVWFRKNIVWIATVIVVFLFTLIGIAISNSHKDLLDIVQGIFIFIVVALVLYFLWINNTHSWKEMLKKWSAFNNLIFVEKAGVKQSERIKNNPDKAYFGARKIKSSNYNDPFVEGTIGGRKIWLYSFTGFPPSGSYLQTASNSAYAVFGRLAGFGGQQQEYIKGWCMELETHKLPLSLAVNRTYVSNKDEIHTESGQFEKLYHVDIIQGQGTLQLLDPVMIELITNSGVSAFHFSDSSAVLFYTMPAPSLEVLNNMLSNGLKIAEQVDHNFPLDRYEKN
ncbi:MAG: hypothetical protein WCV50_02775 [Patescibacteria group bacterium]|jgi:hypothetical protein